MSTPEELRRALREPHTEARARDNWEAIERRRHRAPGVPLPRWMAPSAVAVALAAVVVIGVVALGGAHAPGPLVLASGQAARGMIEGDHASLDDGSRVELEPGARLEVLENTGDHVRFWLHEGVAHFDVVPGGPRRWAIDTGLVTVEVLGTAFSVARSEASVRVAVVRGSVLVRGPTAPDGMQRLHAGESLTLPTGETVAASSSTSTSTSVSTSPSPSTSPSTSPSPSPSTSPSPSPSTSISPSPHLRDVDALRAAGRLDEAVAMLDTIARDPSAGSERPLAAFTRGRIQLDRLAQPREAAAAFAQAITLGLREPLLEDARARRVEALAHASDASGAREAAAEYARLYPSGRWQAEVQAWSTAP